MDPQTDSNSQPEGIAKVMLKDLHSSWVVTDSDFSPKCKWKSAVEVQILCLKLHFFIKKPNCTEFLKNYDLRFTDKQYRDIL